MVHLHFQPFYWFREYFIFAYRVQQRLDSAIGQALIVETSSFRGNTENGPACREAYSEQETLTRIPKIYMWAHMCQPCTRGIYRTRICRLAVLPPDPLTEVKGVKACRQNVDKSLAPSI
jgi:hypothetical protein